MSSRNLHADERGIALVLALFMTMIVSALAASMAYVARTETLSSQSYTTMAHARYGAESGLAAAANYILSTPYAVTAPGTGADPLTNYDANFSPVRRANAAVVLNTAGGSNYPIAAVVTAFGTAATGTLTVGNGTVTYGARAILLAQRQVTSMSGPPETLQKWEITGWGRRGGNSSSEVEVTAIVERQIVPLYRYAAFATSTGCGALTFSGGAKTKSYNSQALNAGNPVPINTDGDVGTNGNLSLSGNPTAVYGTLSTPRTGVGSCTSNNVTAMTINGQATVQEGLVELPQVVDFPTPVLDPAYLPPTTSVSVNNGFSCAGHLACTKSGDIVTLTADPTNTVPYSTWGNVSVSKGDLVLTAGTYVFNSLEISSLARVVVPPGDKVIIKIAGVGNTAPLKLNGNSVSNSSFVPSNLQIIYGGTGTVTMNGNSEAAAIVYAPKADITLNGNANFYGSIVAGKMKATGSGEILYDTNLAATAITAGRPVLSSFTWRTF